MSRLHSSQDPVLLRLLPLPRHEHATGKANTDTKFQSNSKSKCKSKRPASGFQTGPKNDDGHEGSTSLGCRLTSEQRQLMKMRDASCTSSTSRVVHHCGAAWHRGCVVCCGVVPSQSPEAIFVIREIHKN